MSSVVKKKKKTLIAKIIEKAKGESNPQEQEGIALDIPLSDTRTNGVDMETILSRRNELRAMQHSNSDVMVQSRF
jgi:hypothetical protein